MFFVHRLISRRLGAKLVLVILLLLLFSITFTSTFYYWSASNVIGENVRASSKQAAKQSSDYLSLLLKVGSDVGRQIFHDSRIQQVIRTERRGNLTVDQKYEMKETIDQVLNNAMYNSTFVRSVYLLKEQGSSWGSGLFNLSKVMRYSLQEHKWYRDVVGKKEDDLWLPLHYDPFSGGGEDTELVLSLVKPLMDLDTREVLGVIVVNLNGNLILEAIQRIRLGKTGLFTVMDKSGIVMIDPNPNRWSATLEGTPLGERLLESPKTESEFEMITDSINRYVVSRQMDNGWTIVGTVPVSEVIEDIQVIQEKIWIYAVVFLALAFAIGLLLSQRITSPLKELMRQMSQIEKSNFKARTTVGSQDEIGRLSLRFNQMVSQIEELIRQVNEGEARKREAEMRAMRHQINPHFLYNTLSTIRWMVKFKDFDGAYHGISALVQLMYAGMEKTGVFSTIGDELELLDKYMTIQRYRYGPNVRLEVDCVEAYRELQIPRMLMQPIVENAIFHGIAPKESGGTVRIHIQFLEMPAPLLRIRIEDDGMGMPPDRIAQLLGSSAGPKTGMFGIGLNHVHETIQLYYGERSGVLIKSEMGRGSVITLELYLKNSLL